jgi:hypothetical protein
MQLNDSSFLNSVNFSLNDEKKIVKRINSQKNILPKIKDSLNFSNSKILRTTTIHTSNNNSITNNKTFSKHLSQKNIIRNKINKNEILSISKKKKKYEKPPIPFNLFSNKIYLTESNQKNNSNQQDNCNTTINQNLEKLKHIKFMPINKKNKKINIEKNIPKVDYLNKIREYNLLKFSVNMKKERVNKIIDSKKSQIRKLNLTIKTLKNVKEQFNNEFHIKYNQYLQNIERQIEEEKNINNKLLLKIHDIKKEMLLIESKIQKTQFEKEKMSRWFFLQIQVKEKIKDFPVYYKEVIDNYVPKNSEKKNQRTNKVKSNKKYSDEELSKIKAYKYKIIFESADEFLNEFDKITELTLQNLKKNEFIKEEVEKVKKEQNDILFNIFKTKQLENNKMKNTIEKLNTLKNNYKKNLNKKKELESRKNPKEKKLKEIQSTDNVFKYNQKKNMNTTKKILFNSLSTENLTGKNKTNNYSMLYNKIYEIFEITLSFGNNVENLNLNLFTNHDNISNKINDTVENKMLIMLEYIEIILNILIEINNKYKNDKNLNKEFKKANINVEHYNRHKKYLKQIEDLKEKRNDVIQKIQKRINKKFFLPHRRMNHNFRTKNKFELDNLSQKNKEAYLTLNDFMYDIY